MIRLTFSRIAGAALLALPLMLAFASSLPAAEEAEKFLNGLRERGYYDTAAEYLDHIKDSPLVSAEFKKNIPYEQGATLVNAARVTGDPRLRAELFEQASAQLEFFAQSNPGTLLAAKANQQLANVLVERSRTVMRKADSPSQSGDKEALRAEARGYLEDAEKMFALTENFYNEALKKFPTVIEQSDPMFDTRQDYRGELVQSKLLVATVIYEKAKTYDPKAEEFTTLMTDSADKYGDMYEKYRNYLAGLYAGLYQGRCYQEMGDYDKALPLYEDLVMQPDTAPEFRTLISMAFTKMTECWIATKKYSEAIDRAGEWLSKARGAEDREPQWLALKYQVALAMELKAETLEDAGQKRNLLREARALVKDAQRYPNDFEAEAKELYARLGAGGGEEADPTTFDAAFEAAREAIGMMQATQVGIKTAASNNKEAIPDLEKQLEESRDSAMRLFNLALGLVDDETDINRVNLVRYYLCFLNWEQKQYYDAAILGEFLAQKYPQSAGARQGAKIAMAAYLSKYNETGNPDKDFDAAQVVHIAKLITERWPGQPEADEAYNMLVSFMVQQEKFAEAEQYLNEISPSFADRGKAELKVGQSLWAQYVRNLRKPKDQRPSPAEMAALKKKAQATLEAGVERMRAGGEISPTVASAGLSLSQIYLDTSQYDKAVAILEDPTLGPLTLIANEHPVTEQPGYAAEAYKSALRAYVTITPPQREKAEKIMDELEASVAEQGGDAAEKLTLIFIGLGRQLEEQMGVLKAEGKDDEVKQVAKSFETFLDRVSQREQGNTWASRNWVASTYYNLGSGIDGSGALSAQGKAYFQKAIAAYQKILAEAKRDSSFAPSTDSVLAVQMRIAEAQRKLGQYREAIDLLADVLEKKPMMLDAQLVAAYTYQERGEAEDPKWLYYARQGGRKDPKTHQNRIWGWGKLAQITARYEQHRDIFHEARYNLTYCRLVEARAETSASKKKESLTRAKEDLRILMRLFPEMGGAEWRDKYDQLAKEIQEELAEKQNGLEAFALPSVAGGAK